MSENVKMEIIIIMIIIIIIISIMIIIIFIAITKGTPKRCQSTIGFAKYMTAAGIPNAFIGRGGVHNACIDSGGVS